MKYRLKGPDGTPVDQSIPDTWRRIARALAQPEADPAAWEAPFAAALEDFRFLPAGRIVARSEEHTSELQSLMRISYAVFCLKKNTGSKNRPSTLTNAHTQ